ncbi:serine hydrolase [Candidatus Woesearchaeota archaeon]|nr:serine hydrolase [Candidatus Woesearchaeota archaeon]
MALTRRQLSGGLLASTLLWNYPAYAHEQYSKPSARIEQSSSKTKAENVKYQNLKNKVAYIRAPNVSGDTLEEKIVRHVADLKKSGKIAYDENVGFLVYDFKANERLVSLYTDAQMQAASMIKPYVALAYLHTVAQEKNIDPFIMGHLRKMLQESDNVSTNFIMDKVEVDGIKGPEAIQSILLNNYKDTLKQASIIDYIPLTPKEKESAKEQGLTVSEGESYYSNLSSVNDYQGFLDALWHNHLPHSDKLKELMSEARWNRVLSRILGKPKKTILYNKTGTTARVCGDISIVEARDKDDNIYPYSLIAIIEKKNRVNGEEAYHKWARSRADVIRELSVLAHGYMKLRYNLP